MDNDPRKEGLKLDETIVDPSHEKVYDMLISMN